VAFKEPKRQKERIELISMVDMIFILLVFFLVNNFVIKMPLQERSLYIPTPKNELGRAQIVIQFVENGQIFWMDESVSEFVNQLEESYGYLSEDRLRRKVLSELISRNIISPSELDTKLEALVTRANNDPYISYFILIRCPNDLPYHRIINIITKISDTNYRNVKYGCVGGTLEDIQNCKCISTVVERDTKGRRRKNIRIDF